MTLVELTFENKTAGSKEILLLAHYSCEQVARWYAAYHAGDNYRILIDGAEIEKDINGEISL